MSLSKLIALLVTAPSLALSLAFFDRSPVKIESAESKTKEGLLIINSITWSTSGSTDTWNMQQSHQGPNPKEWEQL